MTRTEPGTVDWVEHRGKDRRSSHRLFRPKPLVLVGCALALAIVLQDPALFMVLTLVPLAGSLVPARTQASSWLLAVPLLVGATCAVLTFAALVHLRVSGLAMLGLLLTTTALLKTLKTRARPKRTGDTDDLAAWLSGLATFLVFWIPFAGSSVGRRLALLSYSTDAANHLALVRATMRQAGYVSLETTAARGLAPGLQHYPPGLAGSLAMLCQILVGVHPSIPRFIAVVVPLVVGMYALLVATATRVALAALRALHPEPGSVARALVTVTALLMGLIGFDTFLLREAAFAQMLATWSLLAGVLLVLDVRASHRALPACLTLVTVALAQSWYVIFPLVCLLWLVPRPRRLGFSAAALAAGAFSSFPMLTGPGTAHLNAVGSLDLPHGGGLLIFGVATLSSVALLVLGTGQRGPRLLLVSMTVVALCLPLAIAAYQVLTIGSVSYYSGKALYTAFVLGGCLIAVALGDVVARTRANTSASTPKLLVPVIANLLAIAMPGTAMWQTAGLSSVVTGHTEPADAGFLSAVLRRHANGIPSNVDAWVVDRCRPVRDFILSKWIYDLSLGWTPAREQGASSILFSRGDPYAALVTSSRLREQKTLELYVHDPCDPSRLGRAAQQPHVEVTRVR